MLGFSPIGTVLIPPDAPLNPGEEILGSTLGRGRTSPRVLMQVQENVKVRIKYYDASRNATVIYTIFATLGASRTN